jgi:hypothetical protein
MRLRRSTMTPTGGQAAMIDVQDDRMVDIQHFQHT